MGGESYTNYDRDYGLKAGAVFNFPLTTKYSISPELIFNSKSYKNNYVGEYAVNNVVIPSYFYERFIFGYIETPVIIQRKFPSGIHIGVGAFGGYQVSQRKNETVQYEVEVNSVVTDVTTTSSSREITADRFQMGLQAGLGYVKSGFDLSLLSQYHLTPLYNLSTDDPKKLHFLNLTLSLAYRFEFTKKSSVQ